MLMTSAPIRRLVRGFALFAASVAVLSLAPTGGAAQQAGVVVVANDRGGYVGRRAMEIEAIRAVGHRVEIRGSVCYSSCTMYLGAGDVCVSPGTQFGFHGPSDNGRPLPQDRFEHWSQVMARFYSEPLRSWFMTEARFERTGLFYLSGSDLIRMGYRAC